MFTVLCWQTCGGGVEAAGGGSGGSPAFVYPLGEREHEENRRRVKITKRCPFKPQREGLGLCRMTSVGLALTLNGNSMSESLGCTHTRTHIHTRRVRG